MAAIGRPLTQAQAGRFRAAADLLRAGRADSATDIAQALVQEAPMAADAQQLLGMCLADTGDLDAAETAFRRALELAPGSPVVALNFANWLQRIGSANRALDVLAGASETVQVRVEQGLVALKLGQHADARNAFERAIRLQADLPTAWHGLGSALRAQGELEEAEVAFRKVTMLSPDHALGWVNLGGVLRLLGRIDEALAALRYAERLGHVGPELPDAINGVLTDAARPAEALAGARRLVAAHPEFAQGYDTLANLLWEHGAELAPGEDPLHVFRMAAQAQPGNRTLQFKFLRMLLATRRAEEALSWIGGMRNQVQGDPVLTWFAADALDARGETKQASNLYASAHLRLGASPEFLNAYARHCFRAGRPDQARACAEQVLRLDPINQEAWGHMGVAWRLAGDPREYWLCDYERLIGYVEVAPPPGHADLPSFLSALQGRLEALHLARREPVSQSVRNGTQTAGYLFGRDDAVLRAAQDALRVAVEGWLAGLPHDPAHPFLSRKRSSVRIVGAWSVRLKSAGRHSNHFHNEGWMSSAFYVALPASVRDEGSNATHAGWIQFGQPLEELGLDLPPRRMIRPKPGHLALFPSYMWHGTVPFDDPDPRLTIAFDMQPKG